MQLDRLPADLRAHQILRSPSQFQFREYLTGFNIFSSNVIIMTAGDRFSLIAQLTSSLVLDEKSISFFNMVIVIHFFLPI